MAVSFIGRILGCIVAGLLVSTTRAASPIQITETRVTAGLPNIGLHRIPAGGAHPDLLAFSSYASDLVADDTNELSDVFIWSRTNGTVRLLSVGTNGAANGSSYDPVLSKDGRFVAFLSTAANILPDTNKVEDIYVVNVETGAAELATVPLRAAARFSLAATRSPVISEDGRYVAYATTRTDLMPTALPRETVLVRDREGNVTLAAPTPSSVARPLAIRGSLLWLTAGTNLYWFNLTDSTMQAIGVSTVEPAFSGNGQWVALQRTTTGTNVVSRYDVANNQLQQLVASTNGTARFDAISVSDDGRVAFVTDVALAAEDLDTTADVYLASSNQVKLVSTMAAPEGTVLRASGPAISADGTHVYFKTTTTATNDGSTQIDFYAWTESNGSLQKIGGGSGGRQNISRLIAGAGGFVAMAESNSLGLASASALNDLVFLPAAQASAILKLEITRSGNGWLLSYPITAGSLVEFRESLSSGDWGALGIAAEEADGKSTVTDPGAGNERYYRVKVGP